MRVGGADVIVMDQRTWEIAWNQACDKFAATAESEAEREDAEVFITVAQQIHDDAMAALEFLVTPPKGAAS